MMMMMKMGGGCSISFFLGVLFFITQFGIQYSDAGECPYGFVNFKKMVIPTFTTPCSSACTVYSCGMSPMADCLDNMYLSCMSKSEDVNFIKGKNPNKMFYVKGKRGADDPEVFFVSGCGEATTKNGAVECMKNRYAETEDFNGNAFKAYPDACNGSAIDIWEVDMVGNVCGIDFDNRPPTTPAPNGSNGMHEIGWNFAGILLFAAAPLFAWII